MREIKFRAWDKENKKWIDDSDIAINQEGLLFIRYEGQCNFVPMSLTKSANYKIVFFTGLTDKKGKEIYEGDILDCIYKFDGCIKHKLEVYYNDEDAKFMLKNIGECHQPNVTKTMGNMTRSEIIGNIYENPEKQNDASEKKNEGGKE